MQKTIWILLGTILLWCAAFSADEPIMPRVMDVSGGRVQQAGANFQAGEKIRPVGWSRNGKFAWIVEHFVDGRGGTTFAYLILDTTDDKVLARIDDDSENWESRLMEDDAAESWRRNRKKWDSMLKTHGIEAGSGLEFKPLPLSLGAETFAAEIRMMPSPADAEDREFFPCSGFTLSAQNGIGRKQLASEKALPCSTAWIAGCFLSPFEKRMLVVVGRESFVFEGSEFFYHVYGCRLDGGFKAESRSKEAVEFGKSLAALDGKTLSSISKGIARFVKMPETLEKKVMDGCYIELDKLIDRVTTAENESFQNRSHEEQDLLYECLLDTGKDGLKVSAQQKMYLRELSENCLTIGVEEGDFFLKKDESALLSATVNRLSPAMKSFLTQKEKEYREGFWSDGGLLVSPKRVAERVVFWEAFQRSNPGFVLINDVFARELKNLTLVLFTGVDNTPAFDYETHRLDERYKEAYLFLLERHPDSEAGKWMKPYFEILKKSGFRKSEELKQYVDRLLEQNR